VRSAKETLCFAYSNLLLVVFKSVKQAVFALWWCDRFLYWCELLLK